ncbi:MULTISPECIES: protease pro-enzyme activation domain-containing protein [Paraburkholderia]|uniref:S53 family peptidase n=1 Tax=Paraburkholderia TaxID=1822464 RepID=UPI0022538B42|nr:MULTISPECIES: S53 family peptidase [Paraburkholderia]MCX4161745.1 S53 family peptidase [Paraburkholderia megapolitana]MDN7157242.1 S53 family peptidase [Paraburkholderia sp. CHISQ3]MDQ6494287.1 S53 family peptidase [Paraburkholderia megapolitana]
MNQISVKTKQRNARLTMAIAVAMAAAFGAATAHAADGGWTETKTKGFLPLVQQQAATAASTDVASAAASAVDLAPGETIDVLLGLNLRNETQLDTFLRDLHTPGSPQYHRFVTTEQFAAQYAPTQQQVDAVVAHLRKAGFVNIVVAPNRLLVSASGTAATVKAAFRTGLKGFSKNGRHVYANTDAAQVPNALGSIVGSVLGLQNVELMHTGASQPEGDTSNLTIPSGAAAVPHNPTEFSSIYDAGTTPTASQTTVGIISEGNLTQTVSDLNTFAANNGLGTISSSVVKTGSSGSSYTDTSGTVEWNMDSQAIVGAAGGSVQKVVFYDAPAMTLSAITAAYNRVVTDNVAKVINVSLGVCESSAHSQGSQATDDTIFKQAVAQGQTFSVSAGDHGAYECAGGSPSRSTYTVSEPATSPYVIAVGGTTVFTQASNTGTYNSEIVWNDPSWQPGTVWSTGGGFSAYESAPSWQSSSLTGSTKRGLPDVGFDADLRTGAILVVSGQTSDTLWGSGYLNNEGGTSLAAPIFTGIWARLESANGNNLGFPASSIYQYFPSNASVVNDVTSGNNGSGGYGYNAKAGWDATTGFGSIDISNLNAFIQKTPDFAQ